MGDYGQEAQFRYWVAVNRIDVDSLTPLDLWALGHDIGSSVECPNRFPKTESRFPEPGSWFPKPEGSRFPKPEGSRFLGQDIKDEGKNKEKMKGKEDDDALQKAAERYLDKATLDKCRDFDENFLHYCGEAARKDIEMTGVDGRIGMVERAMLMRNRPTYFQNKNK